MPGRAEPLRRRRGGGRRVRAALAFGRLFLTRPAEAAAASARPGAWRAGLALYAALAVAQLASSWFNPLSFLDPTAPMLPAQGPGFWLRVAAWQPVLFALSAALTLLTLEWMRDGWLPLKTMAATAWTAAPVAMTLAYADPTAGLSRKPLAAVLVLWTLPAVWIGRRVPAARWRTGGAFLLGLSAVQLACLAAEYALVVPLRSMTGFYVLSGVTLVWILWCAGSGLRRVFDTSSPRAVLAFLFSILVTAVVPSLAYLLGLMPKEVLKVVLYV